MVGLRRMIIYGWVLPTTLPGLAAALLALATGGGVRRVAGVLEVHGGGVAWLLRHATPLKGGASAMTLGHVVIGRDAECLELTRSHERVHVRQCERWGPAFIPAYFAASAWAWMRGGNPYRDNCFEREAFGACESDGR